MTKEGILLESGTNEVEILEFIIEGQGFGVNVAKTQAIEQFDPENLTTMPMAPSNLAGMLLFRGRTLPLLDLGAELGIRSPGCWKQADPTDGGLDAQADDQNDQKIVLVMEFNGVTTSALVDGVNRIHRISWGDISPLSNMLGGESAAFTGSVNIEGREILIVDMERIVAEIIPTACLQDVDAEQLASPHAETRGDVKIFLAEDSNSIRSMMVSVLDKGGYANIRQFDNGQSCYDAILQAVADAQAGNTPLDQILNILVSDIEMPQMDGLTLCRTVKSSPATAHLPVVLFSSLINEQMAAKCRSVKADDYISKPQIAELIERIDKLCLANPEPASA